MLLLLCLLLAAISVHTLTLPAELLSSLKYLEDFDKQYILRNAEGRKRGLEPRSIEFQRVQSLKKEGLLLERAEMRLHLETVSKHADSVILGIIADSGDRGLGVLQAWTKGLSLNKNKLYAIDDLDGSDLDLSALSEVGVYIKYDSAKNGGDAYVKPYRGDFSGVIFQPALARYDSEFRQYGNFPAAVFS
jgi:hypothetical protein